MIIRQFGIFVAVFVSVFVVVIDGRNGGSGCGGGGAWGCMWSCNCQRERRHRSWWPGRWRRTEVRGSRKLYKASVKAARGDGVVASG